MAESEDNFSLLYRMKSKTKKKNISKVKKIAIKSMVYSLLNCFENQADLKLILHNRKVGASLLIQYRARLLHNKLWKCHPDNYPVYQTKNIKNIFRIPLSEVSCFELHD